MVHRGLIPAPRRLCLRYISWLIYHVRQSKYHLIVVNSGKYPTQFYFAELNKRNFVIAVDTRYMHMHVLCSRRNGRSQQTDVRAAVVRLSAVVAVYGSGAELQRE